MFWEMTSIRVIRDKCAQVSIRTRHYFSFVILDWFHSSDKLNFWRDYLLLSAWWVDIRSRSFRFHSNHQRIFYVMFKMFPSCTLSQWTLDELSQRLHVRVIQDFDFQAEVYRPDSVTCQGCRIRVPWIPTFTKTKMTCDDSTRVAA